MINIKAINSNFNLPLLVRNFRNSSLCSSWNWKEKIVPIKIGEEPTKTEKYLKQFESRKGVSGQVQRSTVNDLFIDELFTKEGLKKTWENYKMRQALVDQRYIDKRVDLLGPDLAAAHFVVHRGGKIRFKGQTEWVVMNEDDEYELPSLYEPDYLVEEIDISKMPLMYDGLQNFDNLNFLKTFNASHCPKFDNFSMDRIGSQFSETLEELDISNCPLVTSKGLETVVKLRKLKKLKINGLENMESLKLICLLLEEFIPQLKIEGITY